MSASSFGLSPHAFRRVVFASALYDVVATAPFATPWTCRLTLDRLSAVNEALGGAPLPAFEPFHVFFACLLGSVVLVWSALRLTDPQVRFGRFDAVARGLFSIWMAWLLAATGAPVLWLFLLPEAAWGVVQAWPIRSPRGAAGEAEGRVPSRRA